MSGRPGRPARTGALVVALLAAILLLTAGLRLPSASAHDVLQSTAPADRASVGAVPAEVVLTFDEPALAMGTQVVVRGPGGDVSSGAPRLVDNTVRQAVAADAPAGAYTVDWRVTSADGHPVSGQFGFTASAAGGGTGRPTAAGPTTGPSDGSPLRTVLVVVAVLVLIGLPTAVLLRRRRRRG
ncbi:hypothetical protein FHX74_000935 [Friedmanniella endophytica]|uniref:CopC domain-containing protein n=1 Tax=Microlunatus kandeliicorticis TaxID=1759536 RepID=A0A7W3IQE8_9ACTN|nr:copper resistance CopC family protein [Microlunatus kandeliicorticis]MBA8793341.1 hypothetical protein [Microlunatus kandeliicorticis]